MILRLALGAGLMLLGYYVGREMIRTEHIRRELQEHRERRREEGAGDPTRPAGQAPS